MGGRRPTGRDPLRPVRTPEEALLDPALAAEDAVVDVAHPELGLLRQAGILYGLSRTPGRVQRGMPLVGEHNDQVRAEADPRPGPVRPSRHPIPRSRANRRSTASSSLTSGSPWPARSHPADGRPRGDRHQGQQLARPWWHASHIAYGANRGKRSIGIDLKTADGMAVLLRLVVRADVVHSNMRRELLHRLGIDEAVYAR